MGVVLLQLAAFAGVVRTSPLDDAPFLMVPMPSSAVIEYRGRRLTVAEDCYREGGGWPRFSNCMMACTCELDLNKTALSDYCNSKFEAYPEQNSACFCAGLRCTVRCHLEVGCSGREEFAKECNIMAGAMPGCESGCPEVSKAPETTAAPTAPPPVPTEKGCECKADWEVDGMSKCSTPENRGCCNADSDPKGPWCTTAAQCEGQAFDYCVLPAADTSSETTEKPGLEWNMGETSCLSDLTTPPPKVTVQTSGSDTDSGLITNIVIAGVVVVCLIGLAAGTRYKLKQRKQEMESEGASL